MPCSVDTDFTGTEYFLPSSRMGNFTSKSDQITGTNMKSMEVNRLCIPDTKENLSRCPTGSSLRIFWRIKDSYLSGLKRQSRRKMKKRKIALESSNFLQYLPISCNFLQD